MDEHYTGPYIITKYCGKGIYFLQEVADPRNVILRVSGAQLKAYIDQPEEYASDYPLDDSIPSLSPRITQITSLNKESETSSFDDNVSCFMIIGQNECHSCLCCCNDSSTFLSSNLITCAGFFPNFFPNVDILILPRRCNISTPNDKVQPFQS